MTDFIVINSPTMPSIAAGCRSLQYGDGLFTTMRVDYGSIALWSYHLARLEHSAARLGFPEVPWQRLTHWLEEQALLRQTEPQAVMKLLLSRGIGGRGYAADPHSPIQAYLYHSPMPDYQLVQQRGLTVKLAKLQLAQQPLLAGLKHCNRLEQVMLKQELADANADDLLVADRDGYIIEATAANVFYLYQGKWFTPPLTHCGVAGVMRQAILDRNPAIQERPLLISELAQVTALGFTNALMGLVAVKQLAQRILDISALQDIVTP